MRVCLILEGSYPYITGGVSSWMQDFIKNLPDIEFSLFTISPVAGQPLRYELPPNVKESVDIVLSDIHPSVAKPGRGSGLESGLRELHESFNDSKSGFAERFISLMPEGWFDGNELGAGKQGWDLLRESNSLKNPVYPFADYFWAWRSSHDMMFQVMGTTPPDADIYHAISTGYAGLAGIAAKIRRKKAFVLTEHGLYHKEREIELRKATFIRGYQRDMWIGLYNKLSALSYRYADVSTSLFEYNRGMQIALGADPAKAVVIPNGIDVDRFASVEREERFGFHVGLVGRVVPIKDIKTFIAMARIVADRIPDAEFHCIGPTDEDPSYYEDCVKLVESFKLTECFHFTGRKNVLEYYAFIDVMLLTSVREAQPLVILEAYAAGVPVVSTNVGNVAEMMAWDDRFIAAPKDAEKLARAVVWIHEHPDETKELVEKNKVVVREQYDKSTLYDRYRALYKSVGGGE